MSLAMLPSHLRCPETWISPDVANCFHRLQLYAHLHIIPHQKSKLCMLHFTLCCGCLLSSSCMRRMQAHAKLAAVQSLCPILHTQMLHIRWLQALLNLTGQQARRMLQLRAQWLQRRSQARQQLTNIPSRINAFILDQAVSHRPVQLALYLVQQQCLPL